MGPPCCQTLLRHSPCMLTQSPVGHNPANLLPLHRTSSTMTEELLAKIMKVMDVLEKDMKQWCTEFKQLKQQLATSQASIIKCVICQHCMEQPFIIVECGHSFSPFTANKIKQLVEEGHIYRPCYSCPLCRRAVRNKPVKVFLASDLIGAIGALVPQSFPEIPPLPADEDLWAGTFYKIGN
ncbi:hypothetical protein BKA82DRAFT_4206296 [Pisolithus tinctorius]|nr:hypothetical protein BKA82DRAFT_4206296 [Pisolithus tinctorius]